MGSGEANTLPLFPPGDSDGSWSLCPHLHQGLGQTGTQTTAKEAPVCLFRRTLPEFGAPAMLGGSEKQATVMDTSSPGLWKLVSQGPEEETSAWGWGGEGGRLLSEE